MFFEWADYCEKYEDEISSWMNDPDTCRFATDSIKDEHEYYMGISDDYDGHNYKFNETYFCKVILEESEISGVIIIFRGDEYPVHINPLIVNPKHRSKGYGTKIISELISNITDITGYDGNIFTADIFPDNKASIKAFEKAGFILAGIHISGDCAYWVYPAAELENYRKYCIDSFEKSGNGGKFIVVSTL